MKLFRVARERWLPLLPDANALQARAQPSPRTRAVPGKSPRLSCSKKPVTRNVGLRLAAFFGLADLVLLACIFYDIVARRRLHPAYLWGGLVLVASQPLRLFLGGTGAWLVFADWLTR